MSVVGIFAQARPGIERMSTGEGIFFDATLKEASQSSTEVTEFPIESGAIGHDHAVQQPLRFTMEVAISDNESRSLESQASSQFESIGRGTAVGAALGSVGGDVAAAAGLGGSVLNAAYQSGQAQTRSQTALEAMREIQRVAEFVNVIGTKFQHLRCMITDIRQETTRENEGGIVMQVDFIKPLTVNAPGRGDPIPARGDSAATQADPLHDFGAITVQ